MSEFETNSTIIDLSEQSFNALLLDRAKLEFKEMAIQAADLIYIGELRGDTPTKDWTGKISLSEKLKSGSLTEDAVADATSHLNESFVNVTVGAPKRCVDGSTIFGYDDSDPNWYGRSLGPQVQGGITGNASGDRLVKGYKPGATLIEDVKRRMSADSRFAPGDHTDNHADGQATGCGHIDGHGRRSIIYKDKHDSLISVLAAIYNQAGADFPEANVGKLLANGRSLHENADDYYQDSWKILDLLKESNPKAVEKLVRPHNEVSLTINFIDDTTFHRDHYNARTHSEIQNFNLDAWNILEEHKDDSFYVLADAVATLMDLTDGSLQVYVRLPKPQAIETVTA